jgi:DNA-directed RNA polymerase specialized sigma24 family protein
MNKKVNDYINNNFKELQTISKRITQGDQLAEELLQEVVLQIYEKGNLILKEYDDDSIKYYIIAVMKLNWNSKTSPFYYKIRKEPKNYTELKPSYVNYETTEQEEEYHTHEELLNIVEQEFTELTWFNKRLMELYLTLGSLKKVSVQTQIPIASVGRYIREIKQEIRINVERRIKND